jgi:hypothetical protein
MGIFITKAITATAMMLNMTGGPFKALLSALRSPHFGAGPPSARVILRQIHHAVIAPAATIARQASKNKAPSKNPNIIKPTSKLELSYLFISEDIIQKTRVRKDLEIPKAARGKILVSF